MSAGKQPHPALASKTTKNSGRGRIGKTLSLGQVAEETRPPSNFLHRKSLILRVRTFRTKHLLNAFDIAPDLVHHKRRISLLISMPRSCSQLLAFRNDSGNRIESITTMRIMQKG